MPSLYSSARLKRLAPVALVLAAAVVAVCAYLQTLYYPFVSDDATYITENTKLAELRLTGLWRLMVEPYNGFSEFLPLRDLSYWFDMALFSLNPPAFRLHNMLLYLLCLPLVYATTLGLWRYFRPADAASAPWAVAAVTALFALHPSHAEAVVWIAGRKDVLCGMFSLLALWLAVNARREQGLSPAYAAATLIALLAAMLSKATAVAVAPVISILWLFFWRDIPASKRRRSTLLWPLASLLLVACASLVFAATIKSRIPFYFGIEAVTRTLAILGCLARLSVSPESRHFLYPVLEDPWLPAMASLGAATLAAAAGGAVMLLRQRSLVGFALVAFTLICMPSLQLVPYTPPSLVSDRFLFLAAWPATLLLVSLAWRLKPLPRSALLLAFALPFIFHTAMRPHDWRSFDALIASDMQTYPGYFMPAQYRILDTQIPGNLYGDAAATASSISSPEIRDAMAQLVNAIHIVVTPSTSLNEAEAQLLDLGRLLEKPPAESRWNTPMALAWNKNREVLAMAWDSLAKRFPGDVTAHYNAGVWMLNIHKHESAVMHLRAAVRSRYLPEPVRGTAFKNLGLAMMRSGRIDEAEAPLRAALEQAPPDNQAHCLLAEVYGRSGRREEKARAEESCRNLYQRSAQ